MRFAVAVLGAGIVQIVPYQRLDLWIGAGAALALLYIGFAAFGAGFFAGRRTVLVGSIIATQLHQAFRPQTAPVDEFNGLISLHFPEVLAPLAIAVVIGAVGGWVGERLVPARRWGVPPRR